MKKLTPQEKKELEFVTRQAIKVVIGIAVLFLTVLILSNIL